MASIEMDHFGVDVTDLDRAERFYAGVLGMVVSRRMDDQILLHCGNQMLALFLNPRMKPAHPDAMENPLGKAHLAFRVPPEEYRSTQKRFKVLGVRSRPPIQWGDHECLYFLDPDGNLLELVCTG